MAETNGSGRLDRIEAALDRREAAQERDHEDFTRQPKRLDQLWENTDKRIADLVVTIGVFVNGHKSN